MNSPENNPQESVRILADAISKAIGDNKGDSRFIDLHRIPLICLSITGIHESLKDIKEMIATDRESAGQQHESFLTKESFRLEFDPVKSLVFGGVGLALIAMAGAIISLVLVA